MSFSLHLAFPSHIFLAKCQFDTKNDYIICPDGYTIPDDAVRIHGITTQQALEEGRDLAAVVNEFMADFDRATFIVGHNIDFDKKILGAELIRLHRPDVMNCFWELRRRSLI